MNTIQDRLRVVRTALKLTQEQFGKPFKLNQANIRDLEAGKVNISQLHLLSFQSVYNINPNWLIGGDGEMILNKEISGGQLTSYESLNLDLLRLIIETAEEYLEDTKSFLAAPLKAKMITLMYDEYKNDKKVKKKDILKDIKLIQQMQT